MKAVITVLGRDMVGILAKVSAICAESSANITEVTQNILGGLFAMIMLVELSPACGISELSARLQAVASENSLQIHVVSEELFDSMHKI